MADAKEDKAPLIASQKEFVAYEAQFPNTRINALYGLIEFLDVYDDAALIESIRCLTENEQGLRLKIRRINTNEYEQYDSFDTFNFPQTLRFSNITDLQRFLEAEAEKPLPYLDVPLCIFTILRAENRLFLLIAAHHIVSDGYMLSLTASRVREGCEAIRQNQPLPFINHQVLSYARQERELFSSSRRTRDLSWWRDQYLNWNGLCSLTPDREWNGDPAGGRIKRSVELVLWKKVQTFCSQRNLPVAVVFETAWVLLLWRHNPDKHQVDICLNLHNRNTVEERETIGAFAVGCMLCVRPDSTDDFSMLCKKTEEAKIRAGRHSSVESCDVLPMVQKLYPKTESLYDLECSYLPPIGMGDKLHKTWLANNMPETTAEFTLSCLNEDELPQLLLDYRTSLFSPGQAEALLNEYLSFIFHGIENPFRRVLELSV